VKAEPPPLNSTPLLLLPLLLPVVVEAREKKAAPPLPPSTLGVEALEWASKEGVMDDEDGGKGGVVLGGGAVVPFPIFNKCRTAPLLPVRASDTARAFAAKWQEEMDSSMESSVGERQTMRERVEEEEKKEGGEALLLPPSDKHPCKNRVSRESLQGIKEGGGTPPPPPPPPLLLLLPHLSSSSPPRAAAREARKALVAMAASTVPRACREELMARVSARRVVPGAWPTRLKRSLPARSTKVRVEVAVEVVARRRVMWAWNTVWPRLEWELRAVAARALWAEERLRRRRMAPTSPVNSRVALSGVTLWSTDSPSASKSTHTSL
jgi:hypothetical protein